MKNYFKITLLMTIMLFAFFNLSSCSNEQISVSDDLKSSQVIVGSNNSTDCSCIEVWPETVSSIETDILIHMREEEKLARDVYIYFYNRYSLRIFDNISNSEQKHMNSVLCILDHYGIDDPVVNEPGIFSNPELQELYNSLVNQGSNTLIDALHIGATIEDMDIFDLNEALLEVTNSAVMTIFENLRCGSYNHMRAFTRQLIKNNSSYEPQFISLEEYEAILNGQLGNCNNMGNGSGNGYSRGNGQGQRNGKGNGIGNGGGNRNCNGSGNNR